MNTAEQARVLDYGDALRLVLAQAEAVGAAVGAERVTLLAAVGRVLAAEVRADRDQPPFHRSTRDGFACRAAEASDGKALLVTGSLRAGEPASSAGAVAPGAAVEIMTGAPVPEGADCVAMVEHVTLTEGPGGARAVCLHSGRSLAPGENIVPAGAEAQSGTLLLPAGLRMEPAHLSVAAAVGMARVEVYQRPRVAIVATGDELVEVTAEPLPHQIRNSNSYSLAAQVAASGGEPWMLPIVHDDLTALDAAIGEARQAEMLLFSGGVSAGKYDMVEQALAAHGAEFLFTGVRIQPGRPVVFGRLPAHVNHRDAQRWFFGLPGNPVSTMVTFSLFAEPLLRALGGETGFRPRILQAVLAADWSGKPGLTRFLPATVQYGSVEHGRPPRVSPVPWQGSGDIAATARANCWLAVPPDRDHLAAGETVSVLLR